MRSKFFESYNTSHKHLTYPQLLGLLEVWLLSEFSPTEFAPTWTQLEVTEQKQHIVGIMKQNLIRYI